MVIEMIPLHLVMIKQAATLEGVGPKEVQAFVEYLGIVSFADNQEPSAEQTEIYKRVSKALEECPRTNLEITKVRRDILALLNTPRGNARIYGLGEGFYKGTNATDYDPKKDDPRNIWGIGEIKQDPPLELTIDSSVGIVISNGWAFRLYGKFKDYDDPNKVSKNMGGGYPIEKIDVPDRKLDMDLAIETGYVPAILFVGNRMDCCKDALVYVGDKYWDPPENFHQLIEHQAGWFAMDHVENRMHVDGRKSVDKLNRKIEQLEAIVAQQK